MQVAGDGIDGGRVDITVTAASGVVVGAANSVLAFDPKIYLERPFDPAPWVAGGLLGLLALAVAAWVVRRTRPWEIRLTRAVR